MRGRRLTVGAVAHARRPHYSLSFSRFPLSHPSVSGSSTSTPWTTNEGEAPNSRCGGSCPTASLLALLFPVPTFSPPPVSGSSTSTPWTTSSRSSTLSSLTLDQTHRRPLDGRGFLHGHLRRATWRAGATREQPDPTPAPAPALLGSTPVTKIQLLRSMHVSSDSCTIDSRASSSAGSLQAQKKQVTWR